MFQLTYLELSILLFLACASESLLRSLRWVQLVNFFLVAGSYLVFLSDFLRCSLMTQFQDWPLARLDLQRVKWHFLKNLRVQQKLA